MDYLIVFLVGFVVGATVTMAHEVLKSYYAAKRNSMPSECSPPVSDPYAGTRKEGKKPRTMWGPEGDAQGR